MCGSCPFNYYSDASEIAQNYGCLPSPPEILKIFNEKKAVWGCHSRLSNCDGLLDYLKSIDVDVPDDYSQFRCHDNAISDDMIFAEENGIADGVDHERMELAYKCVSMVPDLQSDIASNARKLFLTIIKLEKSKKFALESQ